MAKGPGGIISGGFDPLNAPDAPTIDSVSAGVLSADVTFSAPADTGAGTVDSYVITAKQSDGTGVSATASAAGTASLSLTAGGTTTFAAQAISNAFGPGAFSGFGNSTPVFSGQELYSWGRNSLDGQVGDNTAINRSSPIQIGSLTTWLQVSAGSSHSTAIKTDGTLWAWGENNQGELGPGQVVFVNVSSPVQVGVLTNWAKVVAGIDVTAGIKTDDTLWMWGDGGSGKLGQNNTIDQSSPVQVGSGTWRDVATGSAHTIAITTSGELYAWGVNNDGQLGDGTVVAKSSPVQIGSLTNWSQVSVSTTHSGAIKTDGTLWMWAKNDNGEIGDGTRILRSSPVQIGSDTDWSSVSVATSFTAAIKTDGTIWAWGENNDGQLGINVPNVSDRSSPVQIGALTNWSQLSADGTQAVAIKNNGTLWCWGDNAHGQLGDNTIINRSSPVQIGAETDWTTADAGSFHILAGIGSTS